MGKYSHITKDLPKLPAESPQYQEKVNQRCKEIEEEVGLDILDASTAARLYVQTRKEKEINEEAEKKINLDLAAVTKILVERYEAEEITSLKLDTGETVRVQPEPYAMVTDREKQYEWCVAQGLQRQMMLPWMTLNSMMKELLAKGEPEPEGVKAFTKDKIVLMKG